MKLRRNTSRVTCACLALRRSPRLLLLLFFLGQPSPRWLYIVDTHDWLFLHVSMIACPRGTSVRGVRTPTYVKGARALQGPGVNAANTLSFLPKQMMTPPPAMPECWGHRGASAEFPENTLKSFAQAIKDGSEGIESDVHITADDVIVMFHDTTLDRTTDGRGLIASYKYYGEGGLEHVRTKKEPVQQIPTFEQLCALLMEQGNRHVKLNIDIKPNNDADRLFRIMATIVQKFPEYETQLAPRLILGLWHPSFIAPAKKHVPALRRAHIGASPADARRFFWKDCDAFSMFFPSLVGKQGQQFIRDAQAANKDVMVWTVNRLDEMVVASQWGVKAILTDHTAELRKLRDEMQGTPPPHTNSANFDATYKRIVSPWFAWTTLRFYAPAVWTYQYYCRDEVEKSAGVRAILLTQMSYDAATSS